MNETINFYSYLRKVISDERLFKEVVAAHRTLGNRIVVTIGSWDLLHIGHLRYLITAKSFGDILIVGVDSDRAIKAYKGPLRPVVPEGERMEMLTYQACVDLVTPVNDVDETGEWQFGLAKLVEPDVFVAVEGSYSEKQLKSIGEYAKVVKVLPRQAENTSTSKFIQDTVKSHLETLLHDITRRKP